MADEGGAGRQIGPYTVIRRIGAGGFGETFLAEDRHGAQVVVKRLHTEEEADPDSVERFRREVEAGEGVNSRYVARVLDHDLQAPRPWIAFAHIPGRDLADLIDQEAPLPDDRVAAIAGQLALGLADLWDRDLVHRDLKPANIRVGANDSVTIIDLGIAWHPQNTALTSGLAPATLMYASPWAFDPEEEPAPAWDAWAFGLILTELATGRHPFHDIRRNPQALILRILTPENPIPDVERYPTWNRIAKDCCRTDPPPQAGDVLLGAVQLAAGAGDAGRALAIAGRITDPERKDEALQGAAGAGHVDGALAIAGRITDPGRKVGALRVAAWAAAGAGHVDGALAIAGRITDPERKDRALWDAALAAARAGDAGRALAIAGRITDPGRKGQALKAIEATSGG